MSSVGEIEDLHRHAFLHFLSSLIGCEVEIELVDGRKFKGIFHTASPFPNKPFEIAIKAAKRTVRYDFLLSCLFIIFILGSNFIFRTFEKTLKYPTALQ